MRQAVYWLIGACLTTCLGLSTLLVQAQTAPPANTPNPAVAAQNEAINAEAAKLEGELGQLRDTNPDAGELMLQLINLYHKHGRIYGLVRVGIKFVATHTGHPEHRAAMLKLIDGLQAASRNKELVATCRQFLQRYADDATVPEIELRLSQALEQMDDNAGAAEAYATVWKRAPNTVPGQQAGIKGVQFYMAVNSAEGFKQAATLAEQLGETYTNPDAIASCAWQAFYGWERAGEWAHCTQVGSKLLARGLPADPAGQREWNRRVAENYSRLGQHANAAESLRKARAAQDSLDLHRQLMMQLHYSAVKLAEIEPVVNEYFQKAPQAEDRFYYRSLAAQAALRETDKTQAIQLLRDLLPYDAASNSSASAFVREFATMPEKFAECEQVLRDAISKNARDAYYLRYVLAFDLLRDRVKDEAKAKAVVREMLAQSPSNDGHTHNVISWLLYGATTDAEFDADFKLVLQSRRKWAHWNTLRNYPLAWVNEALRNEKHRDHAQHAKTLLDESDKDPMIQDFQTADTASLPQAQAARARLLEPERAKELSDEQIRGLLSNLAYYHRHYGNPQERIDSSMYYGRLARKFPTELEPATLYLTTATDYAPKEVQKEAALHLLTLKPESNQPDTWYRLMRAADANQDAELVKQAFAWIQASQNQFGPDVGYSYLIGDTLEKYELKSDALAYWTRSVTLNTRADETYNCSVRLLTRTEDPAAKAAFLTERLKKVDDYHGYYAAGLAGLHFQAMQYDDWARVLQESRERQLQRPFLAWSLDDNTLQSWGDSVRVNKEAPEALKRRVLTVIRDLEVPRASATAYAALLELPPTEPMSELQRQLEYQGLTRRVYNDSHDWDRLIPYAQGCMSRKDYQSAATLLTAMLSNITNLEAGRKKAGQELVGQSYARMGGTGLAVDDSSPVAPLMQAALSLRLGDERLAFDSYLANKALFDQYRDRLPVDLVLFVCETHLAAGGDENFDRVEEILRAWLIKNSEAPELDDSTKASVQLLLAKTYYKAQRFDIARGEYTTVMNRYANTPEAIEAEFGIGESFMAQKVYDQAETVFEKLAGHRDREVVIRAEFLRGVLAHRRGDLEEARDIFRIVLDRVPSVELANQALYNLAEVYGAEQRYMDQLELLRTVGRLGRSSKRTHMPGVPLSIVVQDSDLGTSQGRTKIPVRITTKPGGDEELVYLLSGSGSKGLFRVDVETRLGPATKNDRTLQLTGLDTIYCDYPDEFKAQFKSVPLSDAEIRVAADAKLDIASRQIIDETKETISQALEREAREQAEGRRTSQVRPPDQIKPGNPIYLRVIDPDRDLGDQPDQIFVKLEASSGDQVRVALTETGPHSGQFEGVVPTGELPAGALATDTALEHSPLMAIDQSHETAWLSEPDGATPKSITVDMKDLKLVSRVAITTPDPTQQAPVRADLLGSDDGRMWFRLASNPPRPPQEPVAGEFAAMTQRIYAGNHTYFSTWKQIVDLSKNGEPVQTSQVEELAWNVPGDHEDAQKPFSIVWHGQFVQPRSGAVRFAVQSIVSAVMVDGELELPVGPGNRHVDVWLPRGTHELTIFASMGAAQQGVQALRAHADHNAADIYPTPFRRSDFDLDQPEAKKGLPREPSEVAVADNVWSFRFEPMELRHVRFEVQEYLGEAVAVSRFEVGHEDEIYLPTKSDLLALAGNNILEMAGGDRVQATYTDEFTQNVAGRSQLLNKALTATYYNATTQPITYEFRRDPNSGQVYTVTKLLARIEPGERFIVQIVDYDLDQTLGADSLKFQVAVNDDEPIEMIATEIPETPGIFTKEVDTSAKKEEGKLTIKPGDRIYCTYLDAQNTFPGHAVPRETVVHVNQPSEGEIRVLETRVIRNTDNENAPPSFQFLVPQNLKQPSRVAFEAPLTIEVFDRDAAKDSGSEITVQLTTTDGAKIDVRCVVSEAFSRFQGSPEGLRWALDEGRFIGQVILQLGGKQSPDVVPLSAGMPRDLVGGGVLPEANGKGPRVSETVVTRVLNLTGKDIVSASYADKLRPKAPAKDKLAQARLIANGVLACTDRDYTHAVRQLHVGEKLFLMVNDADLDVSDERDIAEVVITSERGEKETIPLAETLAHSGVFTGSVQLRPKEEPMANNGTGAEPVIETYFGDTLFIKYVDQAASTETGKLEQLLQIPVVIGTDGLVQAFSKTFRDEKLAVETKFHIAESYFELFKSHRKLSRDDEQKIDLEAGRRVLREVMEDYPNPKYTPRIAYLLGQFAQELQEYNEAIDAYTLIVRQHAEHSLAPDAQFKLAQCYEQAERFDDALEAYVTLAATYPKSPLIANVMIRISDHFFKAEKFDVSAQVGEKFLERFNSHEFASRIAFRIGQCHFKAKEYAKAGEAFDKFGKLFPDDELASLALFWSGESFRMGGNTSQAFRRYNRCRWDHPASEAAKYARGRLALPEMLAQFESEANAVEDEENQ